LPRPDIADYETGEKSTEKVGEKWGIFLVWYSCGVREFIYRSGPTLWWKMEMEVLRAIRLETYGCDSARGKPIRGIGNTAL
jgi:hypothetical protein